VEDDDGEFKDLTTKHGCLNRENVQDAAVAYMQLEQRSRQASYCLRKLILASITARFADELIIRRENYTVQVPAVPAIVADPAAVPPILAAPAVPARESEDGPCMLFELISLSSVETRATILLIIQELNNMEKIMEEKKSNIKEFNARVDQLTSSLLARSQRIPDLITNLFSGYKTCADQTFVKYISGKEELYEDSTIDLTRQQLMKMALEKYKVLTTKNAWMKKTDQELEFIALKAKLDLLEQNPGGKVKKPTATKKKDSRKDDKFAWKTKPPKANEQHKKTVNGKDYIYCPHHETTCWVLAVNQQGVDHKTGCKKMLAARGAAATGNEGSTIALPTIEQDSDEELIQEEI
jgi:hypothetical protein